MQQSARVGRTWKRKYRYATRENISKRKMGRKVMKYGSYLAVDTALVSNFC